MMDDRVRVRLTSNGPQAWRLLIEDADSHKTLPVLWGPDGSITLRDVGGALVADVSLLIDEIDVVAFVERLSVAPRRTAE